MGQGSAEPAQASTHIPAGFASPVTDAQQAFRALMQALSFPGRIAHLPGPSETPDGWPPALAAAVLTLLDADAPVWLDETAGTDEAKAFIRFHAGAPIVDRVGAARFVIAADPASLNFGALAIGEDQYPDRSATLLLCVPALDGGATRVLEGPGIKTTTTIAPDGDLAPFWDAWALNRALYPLGFDAFLFSGGETLGLPRGVSARAEGG